MREEQKRQLSEQLSKKQQSGKLQNAILTDKNISGFRENSLDTTDIPEKQMDDAEKEYYKKSSLQIGILRSEVRIRKKSRNCPNESI